MRVDREWLVARTSGGTERVVTADVAQAFEVYERQPIEIAAHDRLVLTANRHEVGFQATNGEMVTVSNVDEHRNVHLDDGRMLPLGYNHFDHG